MKTRNIRRIIGLLILLIALVLLVWGFWPFGEAARTVPVNPSDMQLPTPTGFLLWVGLFA